MSDVEISNDTLHLGDVSIAFQRTLRIPDDGKNYPLPPGLGRFPLRRVEDYADRVPEGWAEKGGVFLPMYQREAMWLRFSGAPSALKIGIGKVCAISGERWSEGLRKKPQNYVVIGSQPWLDGIASGKGTVQQFVAMPLGQGYTVEAQVTGEENHGGIQLQCYSAKPGRISPPELQCAAPASQYSPVACASPAPRARACAESVMGIAAGGRMTQKIYPDPHGIDTWEQSERKRVFVHIVNSELWREITGEALPMSPVSAKTYASAGLPWFSLYDEGAATVAPSPMLGQVKSVKEIDSDKGMIPQQDDDSVSPGPVKRIVHALGSALGVKDGDW